MYFSKLSRIALVAAGGGACLALAACGGSSSGPAGPEPPDLSTPRGALVALEDFYSRRQADDAISLLTDAYVFYPARPESIPFLAPGATSWDFLQEKAILDLLLVPERTTWIDQVLLEVTVQQQRPLGNGRVEIDARVQLKLLIGADSFVSAESEITYVLEVDADGDYHLVEERESVSILPGALTVGELRAQALEDRTGQGG